MHGHFPAQQPLPGHVNGHGIVPHHGRLEIMVVQFERHVLAQQGILRGIDQEIALGRLGRSALPYQGRQIAVQLGTQLRIRLLCLQRKRQNARQTA